MIGKPAPGQVLHSILNPIRMRNVDSLSPTGGAVRPQGTQNRPLSVVWLARISLKSQAINPARATNPSAPESHHYYPANQRKTVHA